MPGDGQDLINTNSSSTGAAAGSSGLSSSPWDEIVEEEPVNTSKPIGTLGNNQNSNPETNEPAPFVVPEDIENQSALNVVTPPNIAEPNITDPSNSVSIPTPVAEQTPQVGSADNSTSANPESSQGQTGSAVSQPPATAPNIEFVNGQKTENIPPAQAQPLDQSGYGLENVSSTENNQNVDPTKNISLDIKPSGSTVNDQVTPDPMAPLEQTQVQGSSIISQPDQVNYNPGAVLPESSSVGMPQAERKPRFSLGSLFGKKAAGQIDSEQMLSDPSQANNFGMVDSQRIKSPLQRLLLPVIAGVVGLIILLTILTEQGYMSIGLERVYLPLHLSSLWGGLPGDSGGALAKTFQTVNEQSSLKISGKLAFSIDESTNSELIQNILSKKNNDQKVADLTQKYLLAASESDDVWEEYSESDLTESDIIEDESVSTDATTDELDGSSYQDSTSDDSTYTDSLSESSSSETDSSYYDEEISDSSNLVQMTAQVEANIEHDGGAVAMTLQKSGGQNSIEIKNSGDNIWVRSDLGILDADTTDWYQYTVSSLAGKSAMEQLFAADFSKGASVSGKMISNEKVKDTRCYKYSIDSLELGDSLEVFGITSGMTQKISGFVWIGVKDKLIHRLSLKMTMAPSYAIRQIEANLSFDNFGTADKFEEPSVDEVIVAGESTANSKNMTNDEKRKSDLASIKKALTKYYNKYDEFPVAKESIKLNAPDNVLEDALVPVYLDELPTDPNAANNWYYGYKCIDGQSYSLSARLEDGTDLDAVKSGDVYLYFLYNE